LGHNGEWDAGESTPGEKQRKEVMGSIEALRKNASKGTEVTRGRRNKRRQGHGFSIKVDRSDDVTTIKTFVRGRSGTEWGTTQRAHRRGFVKLLLV